MWYCHHCPPPPPQSVHLTQCPAVYCCLLFTFQTSIPPPPPLLRPLLPPPSPQEQQSVVAPITTITRARASTSSSAPVAAAAAARDDSPGANSRNSSAYISCTCDSGNHWQWKRQRQVLALLSRLSARTLCTHIFCWLVVSLCRVSARDTTETLDGVDLQGTKIVLR